MSGVPVGCICETNPRISQNQWQHHGRYGPPHCPVVQIMAANMINAVQDAVAVVGEERLGFPKEDIDTHSIHLGAAILKWPIYTLHIHDVQLVVKWCFPPLHLETGWAIHPQHLPNMFTFKSHNHIPNNLTCQPHKWNHYSRTMPSMQQHGKIWGECNAAGTVFIILSFVLNIWGLWVRSWTRDNLFEAYFNPIILLFSLLCLEESAKTEMARFKVFYLPPDDKLFKIVKSTIW